MTQIFKICGKDNNYLRHISDDTTLQKFFVYKVFTTFVADLKIVVFVVRQTTNRSLNL